MTLRARAVALVLSVAALAACTVSNGPEEQRPRLDGQTKSSDPTPSPTEDPAPTAEPDEPPSGVVTLAFAGDIHFEYHLAALLDRGPRALGPITRTLREADLTMVNLETAITRRGTPEPKDFHFRTSPAALDFLSGAGVDMVSLANNHAIDFGPVGLRDTLAAARESPIPVLGIGEDKAAAFRPYRVSVRGTDFAFLAADAVRERAIAWAAGPDKAGIATAIVRRPRALIEAVRRAAAQDDVVVVYLHWGTELLSCPDPLQQPIARALARAGADVVVGSHAHVLLGSGWLGRTYVNYGLANFIWYHNRRPDSGVLGLRIKDGEVVGDTWVPALIQPSGVPEPLAGPEADAARESWRQLRGCAGLAGEPPS
jgi:poly-gamma-glutamate synthesis protein (capsule biosynthesis protein)